MIAALSAAAALLLLASGVAKLRTPTPAARMLVALFDRPVSDRRRLAPLVRVGGGAEIAVGALFLVTGGRIAGALIAACYLVFAAVAVRLLGRGRGRAGGRTHGAARASCGCFGAADSPVGPGHVVLDVVALGGALAACAVPQGRWVGLLDGGSGTVTVALAQAVLLAALGYLAITSLPALLALSAPPGAARSRATDPAALSTEEAR